MKEKYYKIKASTMVWAIILIIFFIWLFWPVEEYENFEDLNVEEKEEISDQFLSNSKLHWGHMPLTYDIINEGYCNEIQIKHMVLGLQIVENETNGLVSFVESEGEVDLKINCVNREKLKDELMICKNVSIHKPNRIISWYNEGYLEKEKEYFRYAKIIEQIGDVTIYELCYINQEDSGINFRLNTLGEGGPSKITGNRIIKGEIILYEEGDGSTRCNFPSKEIHELFHVFGFDHYPIEEPYFDPYEGYFNWSLVKDIMFPRLYCDKQNKIQEKYLECLKYIYSNGNLGSSCYEVNFLSESYDYETKCEEGWFGVEGTEFCCPEPNMEIIDDYCI